MFDQLNLAAGFYAEARLFVFQEPLQYHITYCCSRRINHPPELAGTRSILAFPANWQLRRHEPPCDRRILRKTHISENLGLGTLLVRRNAFSKFLPTVILFFDCAPI